ncbi:hypothetical protein LU674_003555 [Pseudomonas alloputida]|uniref:Uncharacterized protein n=3 Tax=Pseudomonas TaxID=286 RepID=A0A8I1EJH8_PSEPU|nr:MULTISPECIES: hypothetical protein [Pseudomonas]MBI6888075.1 hypothetical protein [Pseudomonas putida]MCE0865106.1 hypothetical protein [Pseudomonas alloputida]MDD2002406.1 hypothetical protein [Pseudomonas putida]MDD2010946.1 hypothetical protein [Pseudomonas putida]MDM3951426.1 hypothetical protein [Pseudomonas alloputida]
MLVINQTHGCSKMIKTRILGQIRHLRRIFVPFHRPAHLWWQHEGGFVAGPSGFGGTKGLCILAGIFNRLEHR